MSNHDGRFAHWLMGQGIKFHPDTQVIDVSELFEWLANKENEKHWEGEMLKKFPEGEAIKVAPVFDYVFIENVGYKGSIGIYVFLIGDWDEENKLYGTMPFRMDRLSSCFVHDTSAHFLVNQSGGLGAVDTFNSENLLRKFPELGEQVRGIVSDIKFPKQFILTKQSSKIQVEYMDLSSVGTAMSHIHARLDVDLVQPDESILQYRRFSSTTHYQARPYYMLRVKNRGVGANKIIQLPDSGTKRHTPLTWVRGYFRTPKNGKTHFVRAYQRGKQEYGEINKGYLVRA